MRIIVNADDLGMDEETNNNIFELMSRNKVTSSTLMANGDCFEEAVKEAKRFSHCSFGIHLNLTEFHPLTNDDGLKPLLDDNGSFKFENQDLSVTYSMMRPIINELSAQILKIKSYGINISHIDSHHHVHNRPTMLPIVKYLQYKHNIKKIRLTREYLDKGEYAFKKQFKKRAYNFVLRNFIKSRTTDGFSSLIGFVKHAKLIQGSCHTFEVMVHPGDDKVEDQLLNSEWERKLPFDVELFNYRLL